MRKIEIYNHLNKRINRKIVKMNFQVFKECFLPNGWHIEGKILLEVRFWIFTLFSIKINSPKVGFQFPGSFTVELPFRSFRWATNIKWVFEGETVGPSMPLHYNAYFKEEGKSVIAKEFKNYI